MMTSKEKYLGRDPFTYSKDRERFQKDLFQFHGNRGTQFLGLPTVSGKPVDLYLLYSLVTDYGGFHKVSDKNLWSKIDPQLFHFPVACSNAELALKQLYMRYLYVYERVYLHGEDPDAPDDDESLGTRGSKSGGRILVHQVPLKYNYKQHKINRHSRLQFGMSTDLVKSNAYERLEKSLISGLPNEVDFAINTCCILSMEGSESLKLLTHRKLIDILLANVGLFSNSSDLADLYFTEWFTRSKRNFTQFWFQSLECDDIDYAPALHDLISLPQYKQADQDFYKKQGEMLGQDILHLGRDHSSEDVVQHRVKQVAAILRNLSMDSPNAQALADSETALRFTLLCCHSAMPQIKRDGMDMLVNMCYKYMLPPVQEYDSHLLLRCIDGWLNSNDKLELVTALQSLSALAQVEANEDILMEALSSDVYERVVALARIYDLQLIIGSLDALLYLSEIGETTCEGIASVRNSIDFLVNLVTVETQSFGESALGGIRVTEHGPPRVPHPQSQRAQLMGPPPATPGVPPHMARSSMRQSIKPPPQQHNPAVSSPHPLVRPPNMNNQHIPSLIHPQQQHQQQTSSQYIPIQPKPASGLSMSSLSKSQQMLPATPQNLALMDPELVASNWLRANYEAYPGSLVLTAKLHQDYITWLQRRGGPNVIPVAPPLFVACVKKVFPYTEIVASGNESQISGLRWKAPMTVSNSQPPQSAPPQSIHPLPPPSYGQHMSASLSPRVASPSNSNGSDVLRNMLLSPSQFPPGHLPSAGSMTPEMGGRMRSNSGASSGSTPLKGNGRGRGRGRGRGGRGRGGSRSSSPRARSTESPYPVQTPSPASSMELQVCGSAEKVDDYSADMALIEKVENKQTKTLTPTSPAQSAQPATQPSGQANTSSDLTINTKDTNNSVINRELNGDESSYHEKTLGKHDKKEDNDSAMDTNETTNSKLDNGLATPTSEALSSPPTCNGNHSDTDSLLTEPKKTENKKQKMDTDTDVIDKSVHSMRNGYINGLEKMIESIADDTNTKISSKIPSKNNNGRHQSGDSCISMSPPTDEKANHLAADQSKPVNHVTATEQSQPANHNDTVENSIIDHTVNSEKDNDRPTVTLPSEQGDSLSTATHKEIPTNVPTEHQNESSNTVTNPLTVQTSANDNSCSSVKSPLASPISKSQRSMRKRKRSSSPGGSSRQSTSSTDSTKLFRCLWAGCLSSHLSGSLLRRHVSECHTNSSGKCYWAGCDGLERQRWALVSHVTERHTNDATLARSMKERVLTPQLIVSTPAPSSASNQGTTAIYTPQAAKLAILRSTPQRPYQEMLDVREGPVTKHIRFTSSLILRNICRYSSTGRTLLKKHESHLAFIAGSSMEASSAIVNCLWEIQQAQHL